MEFEEFRIMFEAEDSHWWYRGLKGVMFKLLGLNRPESRELKILDAGCGTGGNLEALRRTGHTNVQGFDLSESALFFCKQRGLSNVRPGSITDIPFPGCSFDIVISCDVLNDAGTDNEARALCEMQRVLKPGGRLFLNLPAYGFLRSEHDRATDVARRYTRKEISEKLRRAGFAVERVTYWDMLLFPAVLVVRLLRREKDDELSQPARSDIVLPPRPINRLLTRVLRLERKLLALRDLPFGSSVAVVAVRPRASAPSAN